MTMSTSRCTQQVPTVIYARGAAAAAAFAPPLPFVSNNNKDDAHTYSQDVDDDDDQCEQIWLAVDKWMRMHPTFSQKWHAVVDLLLDGEGPLPLTHRYFVATMAASRHNSAYVLQSLMSRLSRIVRNSNENMDSFLEKQMSSGRFQQLSQLNKLMAHQPWLIGPAEIQPLVGATSVGSSAQWSVPQLLHAGVIMAHIHSLCSFVSGCGIELDDALQTTPPVDTKTVSPLRAAVSSSSTSTSRSPSGRLSPPKPAAADSNGAMTVHEQNRRRDTEVAVLMKKMAELRVQQENNSLHFSEEQNALNFTNILGEEPQSANHQLNANGIQANGSRSQSTPSPQPATSISRNGSYAIIDDKIRHIILRDTGVDDASAWTQLMHRQDMFAYVDFAARQDKELAPTLKSHDYSWESQGYSLLSQSQQVLADALDDKFRLIQSLTYRTMGDQQDVNTDSFRQAIWIYIQSLYGIRHDDYNYAIINTLVSRSLKTFIKTVACYPERVTDQLRDSVMVDFQYSEKVHVILLVTEARLQAELLYFLRAAMRFMSHK